MRFYNNVDMGGNVKVRELLVGLREGYFRHLQHSLQGLCSIVFLD